MQGAAECLLDMILLWQDEVVLSGTNAWEKKGWDFLPWAGIFLSCISETGILPG